MRAISVRARVMSSGGKASDLSLMTSTAVPPLPNTTTGPKVGSSARPAISSRPRGRWIMGCTVTPSITASGRMAATRASISRAAFTTAGSLDRFSTTPPTSDLWVICWDRIFTATADPRQQEAGRDASGFLGRRGRPHRRDRNAVGLQHLVTLTGSSQRSPLASPSRTSERAPSVSG